MWFRNRYSNCLWAGRLRISGFESRGSWIWDFSITKMPFLGYYAVWFLYEPTFHRNTAPPSLGWASTAHPTRTSGQVGRSWTEYRPWTPLSVPQFFHPRNGNQIYGKRTLRLTPPVQYQQRWRLLSEYIREASYRLPKNFLDVTQVHLATRSRILNFCCVECKQPLPLLLSLEFRLVIWPNTHHYLLPPLLSPSSIWYSILTRPFSHSISMQRASLACYRLRCS
jgi:hypothetical protein